MTKEQLEHRKAELEQWLEDLHPEDLVRPHIAQNLEQIKVRLGVMPDCRTFERDTFDIIDHEFDL